MKEIMPKPGRVAYVYLPPRVDVIDRPEAEVQRACIELLRVTGWTIYRVGQQDARGTQDSGVSDCLAFKPNAGVRFIEFKRSRGGRQSPAQQQFQSVVDSAGGVYWLITSVEQLAHLIAPGKR